MQKARDSDEESLAFCMSVEPDYLMMVASLSGPTEMILIGTPR